MARKHKRKNPFKTLILLLLMVLLAVIYSFTAKTNLSKPVKITIDEGTPTLKIASMLKDNKIIKSKLMFLFDVTITDSRKKLKYGTYEFLPNDRMYRIIQKLVENGEKRETVTVTIPEGYSAIKIIETIADAGLSSKQELINALFDNYDFEFLNYVWL